MSRRTILFEVQLTSQPPRGVKEFATYHNFYFISYCTAWFKFSHYKITISLNYSQKTGLTPSANLTEKKMRWKIKTVSFQVHLLIFFYSSVHWWRSTYFYFWFRLKNASSQMLKKVCIIVAQKLRNRSMKYSAPLKTGLCSSFLVCVVHFFWSRIFIFGCAVNNKNC